ncbi:uncharacterized protein LOC128550453 [Mercenaria mercenaria]|uniref:uncharacterized protein LOC128550453 n=1 Tax=Mercenaria mercenaria TaxID=6596 RepID=UPI00234F146B|nr:uncharacterized protein LOC128550453 [Mercenaria mercenaria]
MALNSKLYMCFCALILLCTANYFIFIMSRRECYCDRTILKTINTLDVIKRSMPTSKLQEPELKKNETEKCETCFGKVPDCIVQYGLHRTATTLQFQILCLIMAILHEDEMNSVGCYHEKKKSTKYNVIKTHNVSRLLTKIPSDTWIFMTSSEALTSEEKHEMSMNRQKVRNKNFTVPYIADIDLVSKRGHNIVYEYQTFFGLSNETIQHIVEYFRYWDILRICCGLQMSSDWRNQLSPSANYITRHGLHSPSYPACEMYNISQVEQLLINTYAFRKFAHIDSLRNGIGKLSDLDGTLDGNYCRRCNANISKFHLEINQNCV